VWLSLFKGEFSGEIPFCAKPLPPFVQACLQQQSAELFRIEMSVHIAPVSQPLEAFDFQRKFLIVVTTKDTRAG
jgi:hypothetical protein